MTLHCTLVRGPRSPQAGPPLELTLAAPPGTSGEAIHAELVRTFGTGAVYVDGEDLCSLSLGTAPLIAGAVLVDGGSQPAGRKARRWPASDPGAPIALAIHSGAGAGTLIPLQRGNYTIGRSNTRIVIPDPELSREHARLVVTEKDIMIVDLGSANGTYIDGERVRHALISTATAIRCGSSTMSLVFLNGPDKALADAGASVQDPLTVAGRPESGNRGILVLTAVLPLVIGVGLAILTGMWMFLAFAVVSAVSVLIPLAAGRRQRREFASRISAAVKADQERRKRAGPSLALLVLAAAQCQVAPSAAPGEGRVWLRLGLAPQAANLKIESGNAVQAIPSAGEMPVMLNPAHSPTTLRGPRTVLAGMLRSLVMQLAGYPGGCRARIVICGRPGTLPLPARFLRSVTLAASPESCLRTLTEGFNHDHDHGVLLLTSALGEDEAVLLEQAAQRGWQVLKFRSADSPPGIADVELTEKESRLREPGRETTFIPDLAPEDVFSSYCRQLAASPQRLDRAENQVPSVCTLDGLLPPSPAHTAARWNSPARAGTLAVPLGLQATGPLVLDLQSDGPHVLVAGTTGSGKSELLRSLVLALALAHPPDRVNFLFIDFKGGAGLGPMDGLVHCVGVLTDLSAHELERTLTSLKAEIRLREQALAAAQVPDLAAYRTSPASRDNPLPHLVIVIDEFRMLVDDAPEVLRELMRIASIGRSLGLHLVMATQRPQGALTADIRANVTSSIALRVQSDMESHDILHSNAAAGISLNTPGRAFIARGTEPPVEFQAASTGIPAPDGDAEEVKVQLAADFLSTCGQDSPAPAGATDRTPAQAAAPLVAMVRHLWTTQAGPAPRLPVAPPLPLKPARPESGMAVLHPGDGGTKGPAIALGLLDMPHRQEIRSLVWCPSTDGHLALIGGPLSGASEALELAVHGMADNAEETHLYFLDAAAAFRRLAAHPRTGAHAGLHELRRSVRVLERLGQELATRLSRTDHGGVPLVLAISGWGSWVSAFRAGPFAWAEEVMLDLVRDGMRAGITVIISGERELVTARFCGSIPNRIYFPAGSNEDSRIAWPKLPATAAVRGRGAAFGSIACGTASVCQLYEPAPDTSGPHGTGRAGTQQSLARPFRIEPLPVRVTIAEVRAAAHVTQGTGTGRGQRAAGNVVAQTKTAGAAKDGPRQAGESAPEGISAPAPALVAGQRPAGGASVPRDVLLGVGGDELDPVFVHVPPGGTFAVLGGPGSGKTNFLRALQALNPGTDAWVDPGTLSDPAEFWKGALEKARQGTLPGSAALLVDDIDLMAAGTLRDLSELHSLGHGVVFTASYSPLLIQRVPLAMDARAAGRGLLLAPRSMSEGDLFGIRFEVEPNPPPGRSVLIARGKSSAVQVAWAGTP
ncbi:FHA domain-containing protein [Arthrobacter sp. AK04]|uniref:FtsK/SpoIIIE domain-containing protein n=1 Tax=Arthrobacter sp. AK04 TaxID=2900048 RepID=UPI001E47EE79|nr:FtsK/SpoIIIE domain-containing protein [Arthrobacter sp. AK04]MCD5342549.1 FHA domain-containing protein [Arthrobacter sp. AK04]